MKYNSPIVEVVWNDAETTHGWENEEEIDVELVPIITIGFLVKRSEHFIVIASSIDKATGNMSNARIKIPIGMVSSVRELSVNAKKPKHPQSEESPGPAS